MARRLKNEISKLKDLDPTQFRVVLGDNLRSWTVFVRGPEDTAYQGRVYRLEIDLPLSFPADPPEMICATRVFHPNISLNGHICMSRLKTGVAEGWHPGQCMGNMLLSFQLLLAEPNPLDPMHQEASNLYVENNKDFITVASSYAKKFGYDLSVLNPEIPCPPKMTYKIEDLGPEAITTVDAGAAAGAAAGAGESPSFGEFNG